MTRRITLFYLLNKVWPSGMTAFTAHLYKALYYNGFEPAIYRPRLKPSVRPSGPRNFGEYDQCMWITDLNAKDALRLASESPSIIVTPNAPQNLVDPKLIHKLQQKGARVVIHDPTNFRDFGNGVPRFLQQPIIVRKAMHKFFPKGLYLPHPYDSQGRKTVGRQKHAVCTARIATSKRPRLILQANRLLPKKLRVDMKGAENRMVSYGLQQSYGDVYRQSGKTLQYPQSFTAPVDLCSHYRYHVDFSKFEGDGCGTQYAQLEAIDAGCVPIMHVDWLEANVNDCPWAVFANGPESLARILKAAHEHNEYYFHTDEIVREYGRALLKEHSAVEVGKMYVEALSL